MRFRLLVFALAACGSTPDAAAPPPKVPETSPKSGSAVETYFPLEAGKLYTYVTQAGAETGTISMKVERADPAHGKLVVIGTGKTKRFVFDKDGVAYEGGAYILKAPLEVGTSWPGEHGGTTKITSTAATVKVPAGSYASCVETTEDGGRPPGSRYVTTYCPGIGMVVLDVMTDAGEVHGELKSYGAPIDMQTGTTLKVEKVQ